MDKALEQSLTALMAREGLVPRAEDLEQFGAIIEKYLASVRTLHSVDLGAEEIAPTFNPASHAK